MKKKRRFSVLISKKQPEEETEKDEGRLYTHHLMCVKNGHKFSIESPERNTTKIGIDKMKCPVCGSEVQLDPVFLIVDTKPSLEAQRRLNIEASAYALRLAQEARAREAEENPMVTINPPVGEGKRPLRVPKKVVEKIQEKVTPEIEKLLEE